MKWCFIAFFMLFYINSKSNDSLLIPQLLQSIINQQQLNTDFFVEGSFKSYRQYNQSENLQLDNNIFFTALISFTLQDLKPYLTAQEKTVVDTILARAKTAFNFYKNRNRNSYNFWRTDIENNFFPNDDILPLFKKQLKLPDDLDDTSLILICLNLTEEQAVFAKTLMENFANKKYNKVKNTYKKYRNFDAYSTWYGINMPVDFDFGVHCNILSFVNYYNLPYNKYDSATLNLITNMVDELAIILDAEYISPYYNSPSILLYHLTRLMTSKKIDALEKRKEKIISLIKTEMQKNIGDLEYMILSSCLLKLNYKNFKEIDVKTVDLSNTDFVFYTGFIFAHLHNNIKKIASKINGLQFKWYSKAFNDCLALEYLILKYRLK